MKVHSQPIYNEKYIKTKARICNDVVDEVFRRINFQKKVFITFSLQQ